MCDKNGEIPGFYKDPKTGKYYREVPGDASNRSLQELKAKREEEAFQSENRAKTPEFTNVLQFFQSRELGSISCLPAEREYYKMRTYKKGLEEEISLNAIQRNNIIAVSYLKRSRDSVFGVWELDMNSKCSTVLGHKTFLGLNSQQSFQDFETISTCVFDVCEGPNGDIIYVCNNHRTGTGFFVMITPTTHGFNRCYICPRKTTPLFCCSSARNGTVFALGGTEVIAVYTDYPRSQMIHIKGKSIHSLDFDGSANLMIAGAHDGYVYLYDFRQSRAAVQVRICETVASDVSFIDSSQAIVVGPIDKLSTLDFRMSRVSTIFDGHKSAVKKMPFSIADNMLCVNGADNVCRLWHLSGGNPIHEIKPTKSPTSKAKAVLYSDASKTYLYQFEGHFERRYNIVELLEPDKE